MNCTQTDALLDAYMDDALAEGDRAALAAHCADCPACAEKYRATEVMKRMFSEMAPEVDVPLAYGTYYYKDDEGNWQEYHVLSDVTLTLKNDDVRITPEDMKHATIKAYDKNTGEELKDVFVVSGYSSNAHTDYSTVQVRIAGQFKVANIDPGPTWNESETMKKRLANPILYVVSATKPLIFDMADLEHGQLYQKKADGTYDKLSVSLDIEMAASFDYFDERKLHRLTGL